MDIATLAGIIAGIAFIVTGILLNGELATFYDLPSIAIVLGGTKIGRASCRERV